MMTPVASLSLDRDVRAPAERPVPLEDVKIGVVGRERAARVGQRGHADDCRDGRASQRASLVVVIDSVYDAVDTVSRGLKTHAKTYLLLLSVFRTGNVSGAVPRLYRPPISGPCSARLRLW